MPATVTVEQVTVNGVALTVERVAASEYSAERATVTAALPISGRSGPVEVYGPDTAFGGPRPAQVNWSALGSLSATDAAAYAVALSHAAQIAPSLRPETGATR